MESINHDSNNGEHENELPKIAVEEVEEIVMEGHADEQPKPRPSAEDAEEIQVEELGQGRKLH